MGLVEEYLHEVPFWLVIFAPFLVIGVYAIAKMIYNLFFHPIANFPGPRMAAATCVWHSFYFLSGRWPFKVKELHDQYGTYSPLAPHKPTSYTVRLGTCRRFVDTMIDTNCCTFQVSWSPVVRISPNELSFGTVSSWKQIYAHIPSRKQFVKTEFYKVEPHPNLATEVDPARHSQLRKLMSNAFSPKALTEQEPLVQYYIDYFIEQIDKVGCTKEGIDAVMWYNFMTFDIIGDLVFADPFHSMRDGRPHPWISLILDNMFAGALIGQFRQHPSLKKILEKLIPNSVMEPKDNHWRYSEEKTVRRMNMTAPRKDFMTNVLSKKDSLNLSIGDLTSNSSALIIAGSETTATVLSGLTWHLLKNPRVYNLLVSEIRSSFATYNDITAESTAHLPYLKGVLEEILRIYPPVPFGLPRVSAGETVDGVYIPAGVEVNTNPWVLTHDPKNFHFPDSFIPERWIDPECQDVKEASQPFSIGSRGCIGRSLAWMEMRVVVSKMFWKFDMEFTDAAAAAVDLNRDSRMWILWNKPELRVRLKRVLREEKA